MPQTRKGASKRSRCLDPLKRLIIPSPPPPHLSSPQWARDQETQVLQRSRAMGVYPSQLRSPTYLADHPLSPRFHPPPYTPQPMLSPLRPGTGLYSKSLPQYQPWTPLPSTLGEHQTQDFSFNSIFFNQFHRLMQLTSVEERK